MKRRWPILFLLFIFTCEDKKDITPPKATVRVMPLGDSITRGVAGSPNNVGYRRPLYLLLTRAGHKIDFVGSQSDGLLNDFDMDHEGRGGVTAEYIRDSIIDPQGNTGWLYDSPADVILLHIGRNDISYVQKTSEIVSEIGGILDKIDVYETAEGVSIKVVLAKIIGVTTDNTATEALNSAIEDLYNSRTTTGDNLALVDMYSALNYASDLYDEEHPNTAGYNKMANVWFDALK